LTSDVERKKRSKGTEIIKSHSRLGKKEKKASGRESLWWEERKKIMGGEAHICKAENERSEAKKHIER